MVGMEGSHWVRDDGKKHGTDNRTVGTYPEACGTLAGALSRVGEQLRLRSSRVLPSSVIVPIGLLFAIGIGILDFLDWLGLYWTCKKKKKIIFHSHTSCWSTAGSLAEQTGRGVLNSAIQLLRGGGSQQRQDKLPRLKGLVRPKQEIQCKLHFFFLFNGNFVWDKLETPKLNGTNWHFLSDEGVVFAENKIRANLRLRFRLIKARSGRHRSRCCRNGSKMLLTTGWQTTAQGLAAVIVLQDTMFRVFWKSWKMALKTRKLSSNTEQLLEHWESKEGEGSSRLQAKNEE